MDALEKLALLSCQMHLEPAEDVGCQPATTQKKDVAFISHAMMPNGRRISLLKTLQSSYCERNCNYCPFRAGRDFRRAVLSPDEMANIFMALNKGDLTEGIFLSSGILKGSVYTQDQMIATAEVLRRKKNFQGYIHLKIMPGAEKAQIERSMQLADRISINLEAPNPKRLSLLAPKKQFIEELIEPLRWAEEIRRTQSSHYGWKGHWPSLTTQFVVCAVGESDLELLSTTEYLNKTVHLRRAYYSAFSPVPNTPLENQPAENPLREHRLYQSSYLLRDYGFSVEEMPFDRDGRLPLNIDPKFAWAKENLSGCPIEINQADQSQLLRIPGIGPKSANALLIARHNGQKIRLHDLNDLRKIGVIPQRAAPFILVNGKRPTYQLSFNFKI